MKSFLVLTLLVALLATTQAGKRMKKCKADLKAAQEAQAAAEFALKECSANLEETLDSKDEAEAKLAEIKMIKKKSCNDMLAEGKNSDGVYTISPVEGSPIQAYCDMINGGWTVIQRRVDASVDFYRGWDEYVAGFGDPSGNFWAGLENIHALTKCSSELMITMTTVEGQTAEARYSTFQVGDAESGYKLTVAGYSGTAGDSLTYHNGMKFTTKDHDQDAHGGNCAESFKGAWWYKGCHYSNPNGQYLNGEHSSFADGINWHSFKGYHNSLKTIEFKVRSTC